jgi:hypothetical protein
MILRTAVGLNYEENPGSNKDNIVKRRNIKEITRVVVVESIVEACNSRRRLVVLIHNPKGWEIAGLMVSDCVGGVLQGRKA